MAVVAGVEAAVQIHIDRGDDLNARDEKGQTPLMLSAARNRSAICKLLICAGANTDLVDPSGRNALDIALAAGAREAAAIIQAAGLSNTPPESDDHSGALTAVPCKRAARDTDRETLADHHIASDVSQAPDQYSVDGEIGATHASAPVVEGDQEAQGDVFDLTGWEPEEDKPPPEGDSTLSQAAFEVQGLISEHHPIDTSANWDDFDAFLPDHASPLLRVDDSEARERLRLVLLRAIREGSVPQSLVELVSLDNEGARNEEAAGLLRMVINDLGAETDERFEYASVHESFDVFVAPEGKPQEEDAVAEALTFIDNTLARRYEPLRIYQREIQREALLTAEAEVALGQIMERSIERAVDALASWPSGIAAVLDAARRVLSGERTLSWMSSVSRIEPQEFGVDPDSVPDTASVLQAEETNEDESDSRFGADEKTATDELSELSATAELLGGLAIGATQGTPEWNACRKALSALRLNRAFLADLVDYSISDDREPALQFAHAIAAYLRARDRMAVANLRLVLSVAKRYVYSELPLDDLLQEGNVGLLKAVDRYDWRRGFKFSTYATWWIRQAVSRYIADKSKTIRLPVHLYETTQRIAQTARAFELTNRRTPTVDETAAMVGLPVHKVASLARVGLEPLPIHELDALEELISPDAQERFTAPDPMDIVSDRQLVSLIEGVLGTLKPKEESVIRLRFGIGVEDWMTLEEIGAKYDVTRERIRQIEAAALRRLKHPSRRAQLLLALNRDPASNDVETEEASRKSDDPT